MHVFNFLIKYKFVSLKYSFIWQRIDTSEFMKNKAIYRHVKKSVEINYRHTYFEWIQVLIPL